MAEHFYFRRAPLAKAPAPGRNMSNKIELFAFSNLLNYAHSRVATYIRQQKHTRLPRSKKPKNIAYRTIFLWDYPPQYHISFDSVHHFPGRQNVILQHFFFLQYRTSSGHGHHINAIIQSGHRSYWICRRFIHVLTQQSDNKIYQVGYG